MKPEDTIVMIDLETTSLQATAGIWQIGMVIATDFKVISEFSFTINPSQIDPTLFDVNQATLEWQESKNNENWSKACSIQSNYSLADMLAVFIDAVPMTPSSRVVWVSKHNFDFPVLEYALQIYGMVVPWRYNNSFDIAILSWALNMSMPRFKGAHDALIDAHHQMAHLLNMLEKIHGYR